LGCVPVTGVPGQLPVHVWQLFAPGFYFLQAEYIHAVSLSPGQGTFFDGCPDAIYVPGGYFHILGSYSHSKIDKAVLQLPDYIPVW
jgi:hypothetical protein